MLILTEVFRLDQEVALVNLYLPLHIPTGRLILVIVNHRYTLLHGIV